MVSQRGRGRQAWALAGRAWDKLARMGCAGGRGRLLAIAVGLLLWSLGAAADVLGRWAGVRGGASAAERARMRSGGSSACRARSARCCSRWRWRRVVGALARSWQCVRSRTRGLDGLGGARRRSRAARGAAVDRAAAGGGGSTADVLRACAGGRGRARGAGRARATSLHASWAGAVSRRLRSAARRRARARATARCDAHQLATATARSARCWRRRRSRIRAGWRCRRIARASPRSARRPTSWCWPRARAAAADRGRRWPDRRGVSRSTHVAVAHRDDDALWIVDVADRRRQPRSASSRRAADAACARHRAAQLLAVGARRRRAGGRAGRRARARVIARASRCRAAPDWIAFGADDDDAGGRDARGRDACIASQRDDRTLGGGRAALPLGRPAVTLARAQRRRARVRRGHRLSPGRPRSPRQPLRAGSDPERRRRQLARRRARCSPRAAANANRSPATSTAAYRRSGIAQAARRRAAGRVCRHRRDLAHARRTRAEPEMIDVGDAGLYAPHGIAELADGTLVVSSPCGRRARLLRARCAAPTRVLRLAPSDAELLARNQAALARRLGERGFYEATRAGISCQSCHLHADSDERAHNLGDHRLLPTLSVRGLAGTGPYLRDGSYPRLSDLDHVAQMLYRGYLRQRAGRRADARGYVAGLAARAKARAPAAARDAQRKSSAARACSRARVARVATRRRRSRASASTWCAACFRDRARALARGRAASMRRRCSRSRPARRT